MPPTGIFVVQSLSTNSLTPESPSLRPTGAVCQVNVGGIDLLHAVYRNQQTNPILSV